MGLPFRQNGSGILTPDRLPGLAAWYSADYGVLSQVGGATAFASASSQDLSVASNSTFDLASGNFSICGWVKQASVATGCMVGKVTSGGDREWQVRVEAGGAIRLYVTSTAGTWEALPFTGNTCTAGVWNFWTAWRDGNSVYVQLNAGTPVSAVYSAAVRHSSAAFRLANNGAVDLLNGNLDEVAFAKRAWTADERTWLYNGGAGRTYSEADASLKTNLVSWWSMNAPASGNWLDQHGSNHLTPSASRPTATEGVTYNAATDGQTVRRWLDRSGNGRHLDQATLAYQPTFSVDRVVGNSSQMANIGGFPALVPSTIYILLRQVTWSNGFRIYDVGAGGSRIYAYQRAVSPNIVINSDNQIATNQAALGVSVIFTARTPSGTAGQLSFTRVNSAAEINGVLPGNLSASASFSLFGTTAGVGANVEIAEACVYAVDHSDFEQAKMRKYLARKWGIAL